MRLKKLIKGLDIKIKGGRDAQITGICSDSRSLAPGNLFIARKGKKHDGRNFIPEAVATGAHAILTDLFDPFLGHTPQLVHTDVASLEPELAKRYYFEPSLELFAMGITGTNGKTTTAYLIRHLFQKKRTKCGLLGTIEYIIGNHRHNATHTTPDACTLQKFLKEMLLYRTKAAVMETTSHSLTQHRVDKVDFDIALFTNLTQDHLDYHKTMRNYAKAKSRLFELLSESRKKNKRAILNADDPWTKKFIRNIKDPVWTYGIEHPADIRIVDYKLKPNLSKFTVEFQGQQEEFRSPLIGHFNLYNHLAAISVGLAKGWKLKSLKNVFKDFDYVPGRMQRVPTTEKNVYIDFAHTEDALKNILSTLKETKPGRLISVFGCGGNRDRTKRPKMGKVSQEYADFSIVTSDNPRTEKPAAICEEIAKGFTDPSRFMVEVDRKKAIRKALDMAGKKDIVLIAGKGHEVHQIFKESILFHNDYDVACELLQVR